MSQILIVTQREYLQRVRSKVFIVATALGPIIMLLLFTIPVIAAIFGNEEGPRTLAIVDESGVVAPYLDFPDSFTIEVTSDPPDSLRQRVDRGDLHGYLILPAALPDGTGEARYYSRGGGGLLFAERIQSVVEQAVREVRILRSGAPELVLQIIQDGVQLRMIQLTDDGEKSDGTQALAVFGYFMGFLIYICVILYGAIVMRGVIEEKTNRISELIASSAKPFDLMMGKVLGIGAMGLTQWIVWIVAGAGLSIIAGGVIASFMPDVTSLGSDLSTDAETFSQIQQFLPDIPASFPFYFVLFFLGGYLLYSSLMAAIGSAVEQESDAQHFMWIVIMPLVIPTVLIVNVMSNPDGGLATVMSLIPLFSPIVMVVRMAATNVPWWEIWASLAMLAGAFVVAIWISSRIYRVGILSYGKRPTFKELARWLRQA